MKPKTKLHHEILSLKDRLPNIKKQVERWAFDKCVRHKAFRTKTSTKCMMCGEKFKGKSTGTIEKCPGCKRTLAVIDTRDQKDGQLFYFVVFEILDRFQVNRFFKVRTTHKAGEAATMHCYEVMQQWIDPNGKNEVVGFNRGVMGYGAAHNWHGDFEIRDRNNLYNDKYNIDPEHIYPKKAVHPDLIRNGYNEGLLETFTPFDIMGRICKDAQAETLLKANQIALLKARFERSASVEKYWRSIRIVLRNKYLVESASTWLDYVGLLDFFGKDLLNAKYVCPINLKNEHDKYVKRKREVDRLAYIEEKKKQLAEDQKAYEAAKKAFFGLVISEDNIAIKVLESIEEFIKEGDIHHHCVFASSYYNKPDSLILSATVDGKPLETVEVSLKSMKVIQSRGLHNQASPFNKQIIDLVNKNLPVIKKRFKNTKKKVAA